MNWDWEKLQEKRQRQGNKPIPPDDDPEGGFQNINLGKYIPSFNSGFPVKYVVLGVVLLWLASGIFIVNPGEGAVVTRFGAYSREVADGPHYRFPFPIEASYVENTKQVRSVEIGQTSELAKAAAGRVDDSSMFTGDENIVHMHFKVQYSIENLRFYLFNVKEPSRVVAAAAEATMREVVGGRTIDSILTTGRAEMQIEASATLQKILRDYGSGIRVHAVQLLDVQPPAEVEEAFKKVASAREDKVRIINQAEAYNNEIVPVATGTAASMVNAAEAYRKQIEFGAQGEASRFLAMAEEYGKAKEVTRKRLYYEAMADVFSAPGMEKVIISRAVKGGMLPLLNLDGKTVQPALPAAGAR